MGDVTREMLGLESASANGCSDGSAIVEADEYIPRTDLGRRLRAIRKEIEASGQPMIDSWDDLEREVMERRAGSFDRA